MLYFETRNKERGCGGVTSSDLNPELEIEDLRKFDDDLERKDYVSCRNSAIHPAVPAQTSFGESVAWTLSRIARWLPSPRG